MKLKQPRGRKLIEWLVRLRATILGLSLTILGVAIIAFAARRPSSSGSYGLLLKSLVEGDRLEPDYANEQLSVLAQGGWPEQVLFSLGATLVSIGTIAVAWDLWLQSGWMDLLRHEVYGILARSSTAKRLRADYRSGMLRDILLQEHGPEIGEAMYRESLAMREANNAMRSAFIYNIHLDPMGDDFHRARFFLEFTTSKFPRRPLLVFSRVRDSLDFQAKYQQITTSHRDAIYRYVLHSLKSPGPNSFNVEEAWVDIGKKRIQLKAEMLHEDSEGCEVMLKPTKGKLRQVGGRGRSVRVHLEITTVVDALRNEFPIWLTYPVKEFRSRLEITGIPVSEIDVLEFFTSSRRFDREDLPGRGRIGENGGAPSAITASGRLEDLILPNSGLTYIWR